jgi:hypothetical protein
MFKRTVAIFLIFFTLLANVSWLCIYAGFEMNRNYIASTLCVNKNKPWLHCNGRCVLLKRIKQAEQKEKSEERQAAKDRFQEAFVDNTPGMVFHAGVVQVLNTPYPNFVLPQWSASIFQPPQLLV